MKKTGKRIIGIVVLLLIVVLLQGSMVSTYKMSISLFSVWKSGASGGDARVSALRSRFFRQHSRFLIMR